MTTMTTGTSLTTRRFLFSPQRSWLRWTEEVRIRSVIVIGALPLSASFGGFQLIFWSLGFVGEDASAYVLLYKTKPLA